jgi:hypothetical protein
MVQLDASALSPDAVWNSASSYPSLWAASSAPKTRAAMRCLPAWLSMTANPSMNSATSSARAPW